MAEVDPEEPKAAANAVVERDFARPLRLGHGRLAALRQRVEIGLDDVARAFSEALGRPFEIELADVREIHADVAAEGLEEPLAALAFRAGGQPGWAAWEREAAVRAVETLLCGAASRKTDRALSELETALVGAALAQLVQGLAERAGAPVTDPVPAGTLAALGTSTAVGPGDPHRVAFELRLTDGKDASRIVVVLPGLAGAPAEEPPPAHLPEHLSPVDVVLGARLGETEVPLSELLGLEEGDVIPLGRGPDLSVSVTVDGWELGRGVLGASAGRLAVRLTELNPPGEAQQR